MQRTYLAPLALAAAAALGAALGAPLLARTVPSRAPLGQGQPTGRIEANSAEAQRLRRLAAAALQNALQLEAPLPPLPPPPLPPAPFATAAREPGSIVALEVVPYQPNPSDS
ncbi:MAG: hypothetical protein VKL97_04985 [Cyanobacteriota bacterium]|nr:hypothetical protein [Cyanobacteriota bacterium]